MGSGEQQFDKRGRRFSRHGEPDGLGQFPEFARDDGGIDLVDT